MMKTQLTLMIVLMAFVGCQQQESQTSKAVDSNVAVQNENQLLVKEQTPEQKQNSEAINAYILSLNSIDQTISKDDAEPLVKTSVQLKPVGSQDGQSSQNCARQEVSITKNPEKIVMHNPAVELLYPGALIQGEGYSGIGGIRELPIRKRAPIVIATDLFSDSGSAVVENLSYANYQKAYVKLVREAVAQAAPSKANMYYDFKEIDSFEQGILNLGFSVKFLGQYLKGEGHTDNISKEHTVMGFFEHRAFTISAEAPTSPAGLFSNDLLVDELKAHSIGVNNPPLFVSKVNYGRILMFTVTSTESVDKLKGALEAIVKKVADADVKIDGEYQKIIKNSTVRVLNLGGNAAQVEQLIKSGDLSSFFGVTPSLETYEPISYEFKNVTNGSVARLAESTDYTRVECTPGGPAKAWKVRISLDSITAKHGFTNYTSAPVYGQIKLHGSLIWDHPTPVDFKILSKGKVTNFDEGHNSIEVDLPVGQTKKITLSVNLRENLAPFFSRLSIPAFMFANYKWVNFERQLSFDVRNILDSRTYEITDQQNADFKYTIKKIEPIYD